MQKRVFFFIPLIILLLTGCNQPNPEPLNKNYRISETLFMPSTEYSDISKGINEIANQLLINISRNHQINYKIAVTSFVNLDDFESTSSFGRMISESLINEMHSRKFRIVDFRTREVITINKDGEFLLTRDAEDLKDEMPYTLMLIGTYTILDNERLVINTRIIDIFTNDVLSTSRILYSFEDCSKYRLCKNDTILKKPLANEIPIKEMHK